MRYLIIMFLKLTIAATLAIFGAKFVEQEGYLSKAEVKYSPLCGFFDQARAKQVISLKSEVSFDSQCAREYFKEVEHLVASKEQYKSIFRWAEEKEVLPMKESEDPEFIAAEYLLEYRDGQLSLIDLHDGVVVVNEQIGMPLLQFVLYSFCLVAVLILITVSVVLSYLLRPLVRYFKRCDRVAADTKTFAQAMSLIREGNYHDAVNLIIQCQGSESEVVKQKSRKVLNLIAKELS